VQVVALPWPLRGYHLHIVAQRSFHGNHTPKYNCNEHGSGEMINSSVLCIPLLLELMLPVSAQGVMSNTNPVTIRSRPFSFVSTSPSPAPKTDQFCLPRGEQLVEVLRVDPGNSNAPSDVNVKGDVTSNCIEISLTLPPARQICTSIPAPTFSNPTRSSQLCTNIPTQLTFTVDYQVRNVEGNVVPPPNRN
jgi:hypothetical protein